MIEEQICKPNTSVDPMTVVARGAALYATQFDVDQEIVNEIKDVSKLQLDLSHELQSVEEEEMLVIKLSDSSNNDDYNVIVKREDGGWESNQTVINKNERYNLFITFREGKPNTFNIVATNNNKEIVECMNLPKSQSPEASKSRSVT